MSQSNVKVSTEALSGLNDKLMNLAGCLHSIYEFMVNNMKKIGEDAWQDHKYQEFVDGYSPQILKCDNIADRYEKWCKDAITPLLGKVEKVDSASVTLDGVGSSSGGGGAAAGAGAPGAAGVATGAGVVEKQGFNMGEAIGKVQRKEATNKIVNSINNKPLTKADEMCQDIQPGSRARIVGKGESPDIEWTDEMSVTAANAERRTKAEAGLDVGVAKLGSDIELTEKSPVSSVTTTATKRAKCEMPEPKKIVKEK